MLKYGTPLLSSTGDEYNQLDNDPEYQKMTQKVRLDQYWSVQYQYSISMNQYSIIMIS